MVDHKLLQHVHFLLQHDLVRWTPKCTIWGFSEPSRNYSNMHIFYSNLKPSEGAQIVQFTGFETPNENTPTCTFFTPTLPPRMCFKVHNLKVLGVHAMPAHTYFIMNVFFPSRRRRTFRFYKSRRTSRQTSELQTDPELNIVQLCPLRMVQF